MRHSNHYIRFIVPAVLALGIQNDVAAVTFTRDIAPIVWRECALCHRAGQSAPFELITYEDVSRRGKQILKAIENDYMPPWPPERGYVKFQNERILTAEEKKLLKDWIAEGAVEGDPKDLPASPQWKDGWMLGKPDLVLTMPKAYS